MPRAFDCVKCYSAALILSAIEYGQIFLYIFISEKTINLIKMIEISFNEKLFFLWPNFYKYIWWRRHLHLINWTVSWILEYGVFYWISHQCCAVYYFSVKYDDQRKTIFVLSQAAYLVAINSFIVKYTQTQTFSIRWNKMCYVSTSADKEIKIWEYFALWRTHFFFYLVDLQAIHTRFMCHARKYITLRTKKKIS